MSVFEGLVATFGVTGRREIPVFRGRRFAEVLPLVVDLKPTLTFGLTTGLAKRLDEWLHRTLPQLGTVVGPLV